MALHAPRRTGKTTFLQSWMREINAGDEEMPQDERITWEQDGDITVPRG